MRRVACLLLVASCGPPPPTPPATMPSLADIAKTCAFEVSCLQSPLTTSMQTCMNAVAGAITGASTTFRRYVDCARAATNCADVLACASLGHDAAWCAAHPGSTCDGDMLVPCASQPPFDAAIDAEDCGAEGLHCLPVRDGAVCTDGVLCDPRQDIYCDGNTQVICNNDGMRSRIDCARSGIANATCRRRDQYFAGCYPTGPHCLSTADRCDGNVRVVCLADEEYRLICPQRCDSGNCVEDEPACNAQPPQDECAAGALSSCVGGRLASIDCAAIGLSACATAKDGEPLCQ